MIERLTYEVGLDIESTL